MAFINDPGERETEVLQRLVTFRGKDVLDVGCGEGRTARRIARTAASLVGVDLDEERIALARGATLESGSCDIEYLAEDIAKLDFPPAGFDATIFTRSL